MTDNEIIKALECCNKPIRENSCTECAFYRSGKCSSNMLNAALDLINRQKAEIERLNVELKSMRGAANSYKLENERLLQKLQQAKSEATKELAEILKEGIQENHYYTSTEDMGNRKRYVHITNIKDFSQYIDNLVKEMTEALEWNQRKEDERNDRA